MKKRAAILALVLVLVMILAIPAHAVETRAAVIQPGLSFTDTKANCSLVVVGDLGNESISATVTLKRGSTTLATWYVTGIGELVFTNNTVTAPKGGTYTLTANVTINSRVHAPATITATNR